MRLRLTVRRNGLPETPVVWNVDLETCTISQLLEQVNDAIPIESGDWGFEDYAVELKGNNGVNYECLHYQVVGKVMKEDDEVIIRPLLTQDIKIRRVSGRNQISSDGKHLLDGLAFGRPLLRRPADRPPINIPPLKRRRITYNEEQFSDEDDQEVKILKERGETSEDSDREENNERQLILHADFDDDDEEDDEDFAPGEDDEAEGSVEEAGADSDEDEHKSNETADEEEVDSNAHSGEEEELSDADEPDLRGVPNSRRAMIRKLHSAFPTSSIAVCKYILDGTEGDVSEAYDAMAIGFRPARHKGAMTETSQENLDIPRTRSKKRKHIEEPEEQDSMQVEVDDSCNPLFNHFDQNGLPPGSISSGKALSAMAEVLENSPAHARSGSRGSAASPKSVKIPLDGSFSKGLTSAPFIDHDSQIKDADEDEVSSDNSSSGSSSSGSSSEDESEAAQASDDTSTSGSDSSDSGDSGSDSDDKPEETSSKTSSAPLKTPSKAPNTSTGSAAKNSQQSRIPPEMGMNSTRARNQRRRQANLLQRYKNKGILPAGTTLREFSQLGDLDEETQPDDALIALEAVRSAQKADEVTEITGRALGKAKEFEARRQELLDSLKAGGVDADHEFSSNRASPTVQQESKTSVNRSKNTTAWKKNPRSPSKAIENLHAVANFSKDASEPPSQSSEQPDVVTTPSGASNLPAKGSAKSELINTALIHAPDSPHVEAIPEVEASSEIRTAKASDEQPAANGVSIVAESARSALVDESSQIQSEMVEALEILESVNETAPDATARSKTPTPSAGSAASTPLRSKLDLGAGRRLLFNALGMRAPKTQKDEDRLRKDLMKDVRPLVAPKPAKEVPKGTEADTDEDPESWREKINYRAVECCQDGIVLSEPPFPFVQRWDPQQQGGWPQKGKRGGKRKQDMRDQSQYYEAQKSPKKQKHRKDKHRHAEEQEYWEGDFEPSYQEDSMNLDYGEPTQDTTVRSDNLEGAVDAQLMDSLIEDISPDHSQGPADLAPLPKDPLTLPDLEQGQAVPGMTIAFKHLIMDEKSWSPLVSPWVTAIVIDVYDNHLLHVTLAVRDRKKTEQKYDEETGNRVYGKFEMPAQGEDQEEEEDEEIDGHLEISYRGLMKPKIVQEAPASLAHEATIDGVSQEKAYPGHDGPSPLNHEQEEVSAEAQFSHVTETPLHSDVPDLPEQDGNETSQDSPQAGQEIRETQFESTESEIPSHQPDVAQEPETASNEEMDQSQQSDDEFHEAVEESYPSELNSPPKLVEETSPEANEKQPSTEPLPAEQNSVNEKLDHLENADESAAWNGFEDDPTIMARDDGMVAACPSRNASLEGISPDLASRHVNGCLDGNPVPSSGPANQAGATAGEAFSDNDSPAPDAELEVSEGDRQEISRLIKDAGFRSSVDSSVLRDDRPEGVDSPGDAAIFDRLMKSMEAAENKPQYSPKYSGLGSSPSRNPRRPSISPARNQQLSGLSREAQSSWQTVNSQFVSNQPEIEPQVEEQLEERGDKASWETIEDPSSPHIKRNNKPLKAITKSTAFGEAQRLWESLQAKNSKSSTSLTGGNKKLSPPPTNLPKSSPPNKETRSGRLLDARNVKLTVTEARSREVSVNSARSDSNPHPESDTQDLHVTDVQYPKLSVGSSFSSMVSDHGRQPDINFDDSADPTMDIPNVAFFNEDDDAFRPEDDAMSDVESELPLPREGSPSPISDESDSEDSFPPLEQLTQSQLQVKREQPTSVPAKGQSEDDAAYAKVMKAQDNADLSEEDQTTPKAARKTTRKPIFKAAAPRVSKSQELPHSRTLSSWDSEPQTLRNQSRISASQPNPAIINLISSGAEDDEEADSSDRVLSTFKKPPMEDYDEEYRSGQKGWGKKNSATQKETQRHTSGTNLRASSQASLNTKNTKKTPRF